MAQFKDPFWLIKDEVQEGLNKANALFTRWKESLDSTNTATNREYYDTKDILMQELLGLEEDVLELDKAIRKCETDSRFKVSPDELQSRKEFVSSTKGKIRMIRDTVNSSRTSTKEQNDQREVLMKKPKASGQTDRYQRMEDDNNRDNESFIENTQQRNQQQVNRQDQELDVLSNSVMRIKAVGEEINIELAEQNKMLDDLDEDVDKADTGIRKNMKKLGKLMAEKDRGKICTIFLLLIILIALSYFTFSS